MKDHNVAFGSEEVFNSIFSNRVAAYGTGHSTGSGTLGVIKCAELHASCATTALNEELYCVQ